MIDKRNGAGPRKKDGTGNSSPRTMLARRRGHVQLSGVVAAPNVFGRDKRDIGKRIEMARIALGLTQEQFGAPLGVAQAAVAGWETGARPPGLKIAHKLCDAYGLTLDYIYRGDRSAIRQELLTALTTMSSAPGR